MERTGKNKQFILSMRKRIEGISTGRPTSFSRYVEKVFTIPRLPVCIVADGLYPNETVFKICEGNRWKYLFVLQDKSLKTVQEEVVPAKRRKPACESYCVKDNFR